MTEKESRFMREDDGSELKEGEWLLKVREDGVGFMTKLTKQGKVPVVFKDFCDRGYPYGVEIPTKIIEETYSDGWSIVGFRAGKSQSWVKVKHPEGFILEIYASDYFDNVINNCKGALVDNKCKWIGNKLEFEENE